MINFWVIFNWFRKFLKAQSGKCYEQQTFNIFLLKGLPKTLCFYYFSFFRYFYLSSRHFKFPIISSAQNLVECTTRKLWYRNDINIKFSSVIYHHKRKLLFFIQKFYFWPIRCTIALQHSVSLKIVGQPQEGPFFLLTESENRIGKSCF